MQKMAAKFELEEVLATTLGHVDSVSISGVICELTGWGIDGSGRPLWPVAVRLAD